MTRNLQKLNPIGLKTMEMILAIVCFYCLVFWGLRSTFLDIKRDNSKHMQQSGDDRLPQVNKTTKKSINFNNMLVLKAVVIISVRT